MSMYKTIFVTEDESAGQQVFSVNGEVQLTGESAFASLNEAVAAADGKAIVVVHKVVSGKYESFVVEGTEFTAVSAIAVDFNGGTVMIDGKEVTVADSGIDADAQATILADLNAKNAANGKVFVAANDVTAGLPTIYVGQGADGYVAGTNVAVVTGTTADQMIGILDSQVNTSTSAWWDDIFGKDGGTIYVNSDYTTDGKTKFKTYADALAFVSGKDASAKYEIVIEKVAATDKYVENQSLVNAYEKILEDRTGVATVINSGARMDIATGKADITNNITVKAGGTLAAYRDSGVNDIHIKNGAALVAGEENGARATVNLMYDTTRGYDVLTTAGDKWLAGSGKIEMVNTDFTCRDLSLKDGTGTFKNSTLVIQGALGAEAKLTLENSTATVWGDNGHSSDYFKDFNNLANVKMTNSTLNIGVENDNITPDKVVLGSVDMSNSFINVEKTAPVIVNGTVTLTGTSALNVGALDIASGKTLKIDSTATITADSLNAAGNIVINLVNGFTGGKIIDITGSNGLTEDILSKITITGTGKDDFGLTIQEGDIYVMKGVGIKDGKLDLTENKAETFTGTIGNANADLTITSTGTAASDTATINADVNAKDVTLTNSKDLNVAGSVNASGNMDITNAAGATIDGEGSLTAAGKITMTNDGHADVDMSATNINIANNSTNTLSGEITATEKVEISADKVVVDGVEKSGQGKVENAVITGKQIAVSDQVVTGTVFDGNVAIENTIVNGGTLGGTDDIVSVVGSGTSKINTELNVKTFEVRDGADFTNTKNITASGVYVGYNNQAPAGERDSAGKFTVAAGTTVIGSDAVHVRPAGELVVDGTMSSGLVQIKDSSATISKSGKLVITGHNGLSLKNEAEGSTVDLKGELNFNLTSNNMADTSTIGIANGSVLNVDGGKITSTYGTMPGDANDQHVIDINAGGKLNVTNGTIDVDAVTNSGTFTVSGNSSLNINKLSGTGRLYAQDVVLNDSYIKGASDDRVIRFVGTNNEVTGTTTLDGIIGVGHGGSYTKEHVAVTITGNFTGGNMLIGNTFAEDGSPVDHKVVIGKADAARTNATFTDQIGAFGDIEINNADVKYGYAFLRNDVSIKDSTVKNTSVNTYIAGNNVTTVDNSTWNMGAFSNIGEYDGYMWGNSNFTAINKSVVNTDSMRITEKDGYEVNVTFNNSIFNATKSLKVDGAELTLVNNAVLNVGTLTNTGTITVTDASITAASITNNGTITLSVTDAFLKGLKDDAVLISQTNANAAALDIKVNIAGEEYSLGDYVTTIGNNDYYLTKGDGNDIVLDVRKDKIYVNSDGSGDFTNFADARAYAAANAPTATIVVQETNGINVVEGGIRDLPDMNIVIEYGAALGTGYNSMKLTQDVTIEAGGFFGNLRNDTYGNLQIEGSNMVVGEADADKKAELDLYKGNKYSSGHTGGQSLVVKENSSFTANNAKIEFSDFTANGAASFTNTEATVQGTVALGWDRTDSKGNFFEADAATMTNTTMSVVGNGPLKGDGYGQPVNSFDKLTMTNSSITVDDLKDGSVAADVVIGNVSMKDGSSFTVEEGTNVSVTERLTIDNSSFSAGTVANSGKINVFNSTLSNVEFAGSGDAYIRAEGAKLNNLTVSGQATYTVNTDFNGGSFSGGKVYTGYGVVNGEWVRVTDSESTITGTVDASSVDWQNYGKLTIAEGAELKTSYFSEGSKQVLTVNGTISAGTFRGYNGLVSETGKINAQAAAQFYGNSATQQKYDINGELIVTHDIAYDHNFVVGFNTAKQWYGAGPNDYWNIGGANTVVNVSGEKAKVEVNAGTAGKTTAIIHVDEEKTRATMNVSNGAEFSVDGKLINNGNLNISSADAAVTGTVTNAGSITVAGESTLNLANVVKGSNAIQILNGATLKDSTIGGDAGYVWIMENATFAGDLSITGVNLYGQEAAHLTIAEGANLAVTDLVMRDGSTMNIYGDVVSSGISVGGTINIDGGSLTGYLENYHADVKATVNMEDGAALTLTNAYKDVTVNMDATSSITLSGTVYKNINVNVTDFVIGSGDFTVVNMTSNGAAANVSLTINGTAYSIGDTFASEDGKIVYNITNGDGNDIIIDALSDTIFVDASYNENTVGFGFNKFNSFTAALEAASKNKNVGEIHIASDITEVMPHDIELIVNNDVIITAEENVQVNLSNNGTSYDLVLNSSVPGKKIVFAENVSIKLDDRVIWAGYYGNNVDVEIAGTVSGYQWWNGADTTVTETGKLISSGEAMVFRRGATLTVNGTAAQGAAAEDRTVQLDANYMSFLSGELLAYNTAIKTGAIWVNNTGSYAYEGSAWINLDNTVMTSSGNLKLNSDQTALLIVENGSTLTVNDVHGYGASEIGKNGFLWVYDSTATINKGINNAGDIDIANSNFVVNGTLTNTGTIAVTGDSTFKVNSVTGTGTMVFGDAAGDRSNIELGTVSGTGVASLKTDTGLLQIKNADVKLSSNVELSSNHNFNADWMTPVSIRNSSLDLNGNTLVINSSIISVLNTVDVNGGTLEYNGAHLCFQSYNNVVAANAVVNVDTSMYNSGMVNVYGTTTIYGKVNVKHGEFGYDNVGTLDTGWDDITKSELTISGKDAAYTIENGHMFRVIHAGATTAAGTLNVIDGASFSFTGSREGTGLFFNSNRVYVDAASSFTVDSYYGYDEHGKVKGAFNSENAGEMVILGDVTVNKQLVTDSLIINQGGALTVGSITVTDLTIAIGGELSITAGATVSSGYINVTGALKPENAEYTLVASGWEYLSGMQIRYDIDDNGIYSTEEYFTVGEAGAKDFIFTVNNGSLYISKVDANITGLYVGDLSGAVNGVIVADDGAKYTVGKDAFASMEDAKAANIDKSAITSITLGSSDLVSAAKAEFTNINDIRIEDGARIEDANNLSEFTGSVNLDNDGHLEANMAITKGGLTFTNTSDQTLLGSYTADYAIIGTNSGTMGGEYTSNEGGISIDNTYGNIKDATTFTAGNVEIIGGDAGNVTVNASTLHLTDNDSFGLNANSSVLTGGTSANMWGMKPAGAIILNGSANLSINGDGSFNATIDALTEGDHTGTVTFNGEQSYSGDISSNKFVVAENSNVTVDSNQFDFNELNIAGTLNTDFTEQDSFTLAGNVTGAGTLNTTHVGDWVINDSVERNFSGFNGTVSMENANASIVMGKGDAVPGSTVSSYFSDDATVVVNGDQSVVLAKDGVNTGIDFKGNGTINVGDYTDGAFAEQSEGFTQTLSGVNSGFTGTVNVSEGATLNLDSVIGATAINLNAPSTSATGAADATKLVLNVEDAAVNATLTGDTNDIIDVNADQLLNAAGALDGFSGTVVLEDNKLTLGGANTTDATFTGTNVIDANADQNFNADGALDAFTGTVELDANKLTLGGANDTDAKFTGTNVIDANADQILNAAGALDGFSGTVELEGSKLTLNGANTTDAKFTGTNVIDTNADLTLGAEGALNGFSGTVELEGNELTLNGANTTDAKFTGTNVIDANADLTLGAAEALNGFSGTVELEGSKLTLNGANTTDAKFTGTNVIDANANQTLNATGALDAFSGTVELEGNKLTLNGANTTDAKFTGTNVIDANADQILNAAGALDGFSGTVELDEFDLTLNGANTTDAKFTGTKDSVIDANADQILRADKALNGFSGTVALEANKLTLNQNNTTSAKFTGTNLIDAAGGNLTLNAEGALDDFSGVVDTRGTNRLTLNEVNTTDAQFAGRFEIVANADQNFKADKALDSFSGKVVLNDNELTLGGANETSAKFTGTGVIDANADQNFKADKTLDGFSGTVELEGNDLTLGGANTTAAKFTGTADADINLKGVTTMSATDAISGFDGKITVADDKALILNGANDTKATFVSGATSALIIGNANTFESNDALSNFNGNLSVESTLTLNGTNASGATLWSTDDAVIVANANQNFTGNVSNFSGTYDIASGAEVTLSGTIADTITAKGDTLTLSNATGKDVTVKSTADGNLANLNIGANNVKLTGGDTDDFTNITGSGSIMDFGVDQSFGEITAAAINVTGSEDALTIDTLTANVNITIDAAQSDNKADVTVNGAFTGSISVTLNDGAFVSNAYKLVTNSAFTTDSTITLTVGTAAEVTLKVDERTVVGNMSYLLQLKDETLILTQMPGYSNYVAVNGSWSSKVPYQAVIDGTEERIIGYDAASSLDNAVEYIKGYDTGINQNAGTNPGDAKIELVKGTYNLSEDKYLMTEANEVTQLDLVGRAGNKVTINGTLNGSDGSKATSMLIQNISTTGFVFAGGDLTIKNSASVKTSGNAIAAGIAADAGTKTMANASTLTINGGNFTTSVLTGGSVAYGAGAVVNVTGNTSVVIDNQSGEKLTIAGNIFGGSFAAQGTVNQTGDASITVKADQATVIRGDIYVSGGAGLGTLNMSGNSYITFTGDASMLTFTGTVSAIQSGKDEIATFDNFSGKFNGSLVGFDSITISGDTNLSLGRRQTETSNTGLVFNVTAATDTTDAAMYTVRDANAWEFSKSITVKTDNVASGEYILVDNYAGSFADFTFNLNGQNYTLGSTISVNNVDTSIYVNEDGQLIFSHVERTTSSAAKITTDGEAAFASTILEAGSDGNALSVKDYVTAEVSLKNTTVDGNVYTGRERETKIKTSGNTTINGEVKGWATNIDFNVTDGSTIVSGALNGRVGADKIVVGDGASLTANVLSTGNGADQISIGEGAILSTNGTGKTVTTGSGADIVEIGKNATVNVAGDIDLGNGNDTLIIGEGSTVNAREINGGINEVDTLTMKKGSTVNLTGYDRVDGRPTEIEQFNVDVDSIMNNSDGITSANINVTGVSSLATDVAGAKMIFNKVTSTNTLQIEGVNVESGVATQIAGADTAEDTSDDVWASLNRAAEFNKPVVVAWGRTEAEVASALDAFNANTELGIGDAVVADAASLSDGVDAADFHKKNNGTLA